MPKPVEKFTHISLQVYQGWLFERHGDAEQLIQMSELSRVWAIQPLVEHLDVLTNIAGYHAIPLQPIAERSRKELAEARTAWGGAEVLHVCVLNPRVRKGFSHASVPLWMLQLGVTTEYLRDQYYAHAKMRNHFAETWRVAYIARTGRDPGNGPETGG